MLYTSCFLALIGVIILGSLYRNCDSVCGDTIIPHPFGSGFPCSGHGSFHVKCKGTPKSRKPILTKYNLEVVDVHITDQNKWSIGGEITVNMPSLRVCPSNDKNTNISVSVVKQSRLIDVDLRGSRFSFGYGSNAFASVGCDGNASLYSEHSKFGVSCSSSCKPTGSGSGWCYKTLDFDTANLKLDVDMRERGGDCRSAFLISKAFVRALDNVAIVKAIGSGDATPVVLSWRYNTTPSERFGTLIMLMVFGPVATLLVSCSCFWLCWLYKTKERRKEARLRAKYFNGRLRDQRSFRAGTFQNTKLYRIKELKKATKNFNENQVIGEGGQGTVYKGIFTNGQIIAVKKSKSFDESQWKQFINEVILLSQINHRNVVKLLGCCLETKLPLLVYEFISNGSLSQHIHVNGFLLVWEIRVQIASDIARALAHLHSSSLVPIYHRDIKSSNILLDDKYRAKISDFGISKALSADQTHLITCVRGTLGYLDPEYFRSSQFSEKSDVYSFGVILVELLTGQHPIREATLDDERSLVVYFVSSMNESTLDGILDPVVLEGSLEEDVTLVAKLAKRCLNARGVERPTMREVFLELEGLRKKLSSSTFVEIPQVLT